MGLDLPLPSINKDLVGLDLPLPKIPLEPTTKPSPPRNFLLPPTTTSPTTRALGRRMSRKLYASYMDMLI